MGEHTTLISWNGFQKTFLDRFFPRAIGEAEVVEFMNLRLGYL